jgi:hypothetical protein
MVSITDFVPREGWPGSLLEIIGTDFAPERDDNVVDIAGVPAVVVDAAPQRLQVLVGPGTGAGPVSVTVAGQTVAGPTDFAVAGPADAGDLTQDGQPIFFDGPQRGTPQRGVQDQRLLVILCFPTDQDPGNAAARQMKRNDEMASFDDANRFWREASYGTTTWRFDFTDWLALPNTRNHYMWQQEDIDDARRRLLGLTRRGVTVSGQRVLTGALGLAAPIGSSVRVVDASNAAAPAVTGRYPIATTVATGIAVVGDRAYISTASDGLHVVDVANPAAPTRLAHLPLATYQEDVDATSTVAVVAARENGIFVYDLTLTPPTPVPVSSMGFGAGQWATAVRLAGTRAYVAVGRSLRVIDLANPASPVVLANVGVGAWAMGVDVTGTVCAVATDGDGLQIFDVTNPVPVLLSAERSALRPYDVSLSGGFAYVAAGDQGLRVIDVTAPATPKEVAQLPTSAAAVAVAASAGRAYVAVGGGRLAVVDVSTPATPTLTATVFLSSLPAQFDPNLQALRDGLATAENLQDITQRRGDLMLDAARAAQAAGFDLGSFEGIIVDVHGPFLRGQSWTTNTLQSEDGTDTLNFPSAKGVIYLATRSHWGRKAHEIGHWLGMWDIYTEQFADGTFLPGTAAAWDLAGNHDQGPLFSGHQIHEVMGFYDTLPPNPNVVTRTWSPTAPPMNEVFDIVAHGSMQDSAPTPIHVLKLVVAQGLVYYVEVRQRPGAVIFDQQIPTPPNPDGGVVLVTRATEGTTISNTRERPIMLFDTIDVGQRVVDAARRLTIEVVSKLQTNPLAYRVRVEWNQPDPTDPNGKFDLSLTPWNEKWETVDIWVDSPRNGIGTFEFHEQGKPTKPVLNGDRPWVNRVNKINARIRNTGGAAVSDVYVTFYVNSPPGIGDNGSWGTLGTRHLPTVPARDPAIPDSGSVTVDFDWTPVSDKHTCIKVAVLPKPGEIETGNNSAQENVAHFDSAGSSSHQPVLLEAEVRSPFVVWRRVDMVVRGLPAGWHCAVDHAWLWLPPQGTKAVSAVIWTDLGTPAADRHPKIPRRAEARVEGWTDFDHRYLPIGGILAVVNANRRVHCDAAVDMERDQLLVNGCLSPPLDHVPITIEITDSTGRREHIVLATDKNGCYDTRQMAGGAPSLKPGTYTIQVFVTAGGEAAETECPPVTVHVR